MSKFLTFLIIVILGTVSRCNSPLSGDPGNGSETIAVIEGQLFAPEGVPVKGAEIRMIHSDYIPDSTDQSLSANHITWSDTNGYYLLTSEIKTGQNYNIQVNYKQRGLGIAHPFVTFTGNKASFFNDTIREHGSLLVKLPSGITNGMIMMRGTTCQVAVNETEKKHGYIILDSIPAGTRGQIEVVSNGDKQVLSDTVTVISGTKTLLTSFIIYSDSISLVTDTSIWANCCTLTEDTLSPAFEGKKTYRFEYQIIDWFAGAGMNLDDWNRISPFDISRCKSVRFAYRGLAPDHKLYLQLKEGENVSSAVECGSASDIFATVEVPLSSFKDVDLSRFKEIVFGVSGSESGDGTVWIDAIEIVY